MRATPHWRKLALAAAVLAVLIAPAALPRASLAAGKGMAMREKVYEKLSRAQEAAESQDWETAFDALEDLEKMKDLSSSEKAQLYTAYGYTYFAQDNFAESAAAYEKVLLEKDLPEAMRVSTLYTLGQLHFHLEHYDQAAGYLEQWLQLAENPGPEPYVLLGQAYYQLGRLDEAAAPVRQAIAVARQRQTRVQENWYALLRVIYFETKDYDRLLEVLEVLVSEYPKKEYWLHLAAAYGDMEDEVRQLACYEMAHELGYLTRSSEIVLLSQLLMQAEVPFRAGVLLQDGLDSGRVEGTAANWRLVSQAWILAQEHARAVTSLSRAAELSDDGELHARIAQTYVNLGEWEKAIAAARTALDKGVDDPQELQLMQGMAYFELGRFPEAKLAFTAAQKSKEGRATASRWLDFVEREEERLAQLGLKP
jgi:tetratricopeptide (TPR) repeat protein